jgi:hypothetical protein
MLAETHRRIALALSETINLKSCEMELFVEGSLAPDAWCNYPHHVGKDREIAARIIEAKTS